MEYKKTLTPSLFIQKNQYCSIKHSYKASFDDLKLFMKGMRIVKRNVSKFYKTVAEDMLWSVLGFEKTEKNINISVEESELKDIIIKKIKKYVLNMDHNKDLELFKLTAKYDPTYRRISAKDFWNMEERKNFSSTTKGNKMVLDFVAQLSRNRKTLESGRFFYIIIEKNVKSISEKICLFDDFNSLKNRIDIIHYFNSLKDIIASLLSCNTKQAEDLIKGIYKDNTEKTTQKSIASYFGGNSTVAVVENKKRTKNKLPEIIIPKKMRLENMFNKKS